LLPLALATRLLLNPKWPVEALGFPVGFLLAGGCEEPLFRGFLWGFLKENRWPEVLIWIFQALLFGLAHGDYYFTYPDPWIWQRTFVGGLILGLVAWRSRSIVASALVHGILNM
jgi:membrane protease YdiL (CAAX protease family)